MVQSSSQHRLFGCCFCYYFNWPAPSYSYLSLPILFTIFALQLLFLLFTSGLSLWPPFLPSLSWLSSPLLLFQQSPSLSFPFRLFPHQPSVMPISLPSTMLFFLPLLVKLSCELLLLPQSGSFRPIQLLLSLRPLF